MFNIGSGLILIRPLITIRRFQTGNRANSRWQRQCKAQLSFKPDKKAPTSHSLTNNVRGIVLYTNNTHTVCKLYRIEAYAIQMRPKCTNINTWRSWKLFEQYYDSLNAVLGLLNVHTFLKQLLLILSILEEIRW